MTGGLKQYQLDRIREVFSRHPEVEEAILYGSRAKKTNTPGSDIDLTLKGQGLNLKLLNKISLELDDLLLPYHIDLSLYDTITETDLREHIDQVGVLLYSKRDVHVSS